MVQLLLGLFPQSPYRNVSLQCLTEVAALTMDESFDDRFQNFYKVFSQQLFQILPPGAPLAPPPPRRLLVPHTPRVFPSQPRRGHSPAQPGAQHTFACNPPPTHTDPHTHTHTHTPHRLQTKPKTIQTPLCAPPGTNIEAAYSAGTDEQQAFVQNLALFYTSFLRVRRGRSVFAALRLAPRA